MKNFLFYLGLTVIGLNALTACIHLFKGNFFLMVLYIFITMIFTFSHWSNIEKVLNEKKAKKNKALAMTALRLKEEAEKRQKEIEDKKFRFFDY